MHYYDLYTSMVDKVDMKFTVDEGQELILKGLVPLGKDYNNVLKRADELLYRAKNNGRNRIELG